MNLPFQPLAYDLKFKKFIVWQAIKRTKVCTKQSYNRRRTSSS